MKYLKKFESITASYDGIIDILLFRDLLKQRTIFKTRYIKEEADEKDEKDEIKVYDPGVGFINVSKSKMKELEDKFPELLQITEEMQKLSKEAAGVDNDKFEKFTDEITQTEGVKAALGVLKKFVKENGVMNSFKILTNVIKLVKKQMEFEKRASKIVPKDEKYILNDGSEIGILIVGGRPSALEVVIKTISEALTIKNLTKVLTGRTEDLEKLEVEYLKKDGQEASGELKAVEITDDGEILVSIETDKAGDIKKNLTDITGEAEGEAEVDLQKKMTDILKNKPDEVRRILSFTNFISDDKNKDKVVDIEKIMGTK